MTDCLAIRLHRTGTASELTVETVAVPPPGPGEVRIRHTAIGVNFVDIYHRRGQYPMALPGSPGMEGAGVVDALGPGVRDLRVGQRIAYALPAPGSYAQLRNVPAARALPLPDTVPDAVAAGALLRGVFCHLLLAHLLRVRQGDTLLLHAAAGGLGLMLAQWADGLGVRVLGTVGSAHKAALAAAHGVRETILYRNTDFVQAVRALTDGQGAHYAVDGVGGATLLRSVQAVRTGGLLASVGMAAGPVDASVTAAAHARNLALARPSVTRFMGDAGAYRRAAEATLARLADGLKVHIGAHLPLAQAAYAHELLESGATEGVIVLAPEETPLSPPSPPC